MIDELSKCQKANFIFEPSLVPVILSLSVQNTNLILERKITYIFRRNWVANNCLDAKMGFTDHEYIQPLILDSIIILKYSLSKIKREDNQLNEIDCIVQGNNLIAF